MIFFGTCRLETDTYNLPPEQDQQLDRLSHSISRQHNLSVQINEELDVHHGLLQELDAEVDRTEGRLGRARRKLDQVAKGAKENGSFIPFLARN